MTYVWFTGNTRPSLYYTVKANGQPVDLFTAGFTEARFSMRPAEDPLGTPKVDLALAAILDDGTTDKRGQLRYDPELSDVDTPGEYMAWFTLAAGTDTQDTPEFEVRVREHAPTQEWVTPQDVIQTLRLGGRARPVTASEMEVLDQTIAAATSRVENYTRHRFTQETATTKRFSMFEGGLIDLSPWDLRSVPATVTLDLDISPSGVELTPWNWRVEPRTAPHGIYTHLLLAYGYPARAQTNWWADDHHAATTLGRQLSVTADWGWPVLPADLKTAIIELAATMWANPKGEQQPSVRLLDNLGWPQGVKPIIDSYARPSL